MSQDSLQREILIDQRVNSKKKSKGVAYLLWILAGGLGVHRFYLGETVTGAILLVITLISFAFPPLLAVTVIWCLVDLFLIPSMVNKHMEKIKHDARIEVLSLEKMNRL